MAHKKKKGIWGTDFIEDLVRLHTDGILTKEEVHREMNKILWPHYDRTIHAEKPPEHMSPTNIMPGQFEPDPPGTRAAMGGEWYHHPYEARLPGLLDDYDELANKGMYFGKQTEDIWGLRTGDKPKSIEFVKELSDIQKYEDSLENRYPEDVEGLLAEQAEYDAYMRELHGPDWEDVIYEESASDQAVAEMMREVQALRDDERKTVANLFEDTDYAERAGKHGYEIEYGPTPKQGTATFVRHGDKKIYFDPEMAEEKYTTKAWETPRVEGVDPIEGEHFPNKEKWYKFLHEHELAHLSNKQREGESKADYENRVNQLALDALLEGEEIAGGASDLGGLLSFLVDKGSGVAGRLLGGAGMALYPSSTALDEGEDVQLMREMQNELRRRRAY